MSGAPTAVAMSGGLDSSVAAWLLSRSEPVIGLSMLLTDRSAEGGHGRCCGALDLGDARRVAAQCGIPHYTLRMEEEFERAVVDPFVADYLAGRTPIPCTRCNTWIKFGLFLERARALGAGRVATGHYARIVDGPHGPELHAAADRDKDQSYYLFELTREQLAASRFPLGERTKPEVRRLAEEAELVVAGKGESMEVCFVPGGVREFVEARVAEHPERHAGGRASAARSHRAVPAEEPRSAGVAGVGRWPLAGAEIVDRAGAALGRGEPYYRYTVGQRRGLGVASGERLYVLEVRPERNQVIVGDLEALRAPGLAGDGLHWIGPEPGGEVEATVKIRARHPGVPARVRPTGGGGEVEVEFAEPQVGVAPGQAAVFYRGTRVLGGCWIRARL